MTALVSRDPARAADCAFPSSGRFCVLDIETAPDEEALSLVARGGREAYGRTALHSLTAASTLMFERGEAGFGGFRLESLRTAVSDEPDLLVRLDARLSAVYHAGGGLTTTGFSRCSTSPVGVVRSLGAIST